jgi:hypothetical protein
MAPVYRTHHVEGGTWRTTTSNAMDLLFRMDGADQQLYSEGCTLDQAKAMCDAGAKTIEQAILARGAATVLKAGGWRGRIQRCSPDGQNGPLRRAEPPAAPIA